MRNRTAAMSIAEEFSAKVQREQRRDKLIRWAPVIVLFALVTIFSILRFDSFFTLYNLNTIFNQMSITLIIAVGATFVVLIGSVDLTVDGVVGLASCTVALLILNGNNENNFGIFGVLIAISVGLAFGLLTGFIHVRFRISSFMVTYALGAVAVGCGILFSGGLWAQIKDASLLAIPAASFLGIPVITWISFVVLGIAWVIQEKTPFGRHMIAIGTNEEVPRVTGVKVDLVKVMIFMWSGLCLGLAGVLGALRLARGEADVGTGQFFTAYAAVIVGGTSLSGGRGGVINTLIGVLIITVLNNGLLLMDVNIFIRSGMQGLIILVAIALTIDRNRRAICK
ncbi:MAG: ABC transporter permease [Clostridiales bacterium]|nr:ABC transporter permease [Clostridiales bacterium]